MPASKKFRHVESAADRRGDAALAGAVTTAIGLIRIVIESLFAAFAAQYHIHAGLGERRRDAVLAQMTGEVTGNHRLVR